MSEALHPRLQVVDHPLVKTRLATLRDRNTSPVHFRKALKQLTSLLVQEATRTLQLRTVEVQTPLATCEGHVMAREIIVVPILRAALGMAEAVLEILPEATVGHIGLARDEATHRPTSYYAKHPSHLADAVTLLVDPMLATGFSASAAMDKLKKEGAGQVVFTCIVSCPEGLRQLALAHPEIHVFTASIDEGLNEQAYIVPGLGDAGDRYFGTL